MIVAELRYCQLKNLTHKLLASNRQAESNSQRCLDAPTPQILFWKIESDLLSWYNNVNDSTRNK